uniref:HMG box domain-containing protein n=2 Tax=Setaria viridis TaxID=4556 RepID=A0A4U6TYD2_SETVI|nr:hypothetical protein SEVIR_6G001300v2 [Setaria viridis]
MEGEAALAPTEGSIWAVRLQRRPALGGPRSDAACLPAARQIQIPQTKRNRIMKLIFVWVCRHFGISQLHLPPDPAPAASSINLPPSHVPWIQSHSLGGQASPLSISNQAPSADPKSMAGGNKSTGNAARSRKRVEATILKRSRDGSAFTRCEACNKDVPVVLIDMHSCSLDAKIRETLEAQVVERTIEVTKPADRKKPAKAGAANKDGKRKRTPTAFFLFMDDFRKEFKAANPDNKNVATVAKEGGERWKSMTDEEKKPYQDKAAELKAHAENGEGSGENNVAAEKPKADDTEGGQEVDQPAKRLRRKVDDEDEACDEEDEDEKNVLDDDLDDDM